MSQKPDDVLTVSSDDSRELDAATLPRWPDEVRAVIARARIAGGYLYVGACVHTSRRPSRPANEPGWWMLGDLKDAPWWSGAIPAECRWAQVMEVACCAAPWHRMDGVGTAGVAAVRFWLPTGVSSWYTKAGHERFKAMTYKAARAAVMAHFRDPDWCTIVYNPKPQELA